MNYRRTVLPPFLLGSLAVILMAAGAISSVVFIVYLTITPTVTMGQGNMPTPIGPASWQKPNGDIQRGFGPGGAPALNYQKADGSWDYIVNDWEQIGNKKAWRSLRGPHRLWADSTGAAIYARGNHYLGTRTLFLIKFNPSDSTWQTLRTSNPDSVTSEGSRLTFHGIAPGINKHLTNAAKGVGAYSETFEFTQDGRDYLATHGPWAGRWLGTATRLATDSLNLTLRDAKGVFGVGPRGRMTDRWISFGSADTSAFWLATNVIHTSDSATSIPVRKFIVQRAGSTWLVELFNPMRAAQLPSGTIWHNATWFGNQSTETLKNPIDNRLTGMIASPSSSGTLDSVTAYIFYDVLLFGTGVLWKMGVVLASDSSMVDTTSEQNWSAPSDRTEWRGLPCQLNSSITSGTDYWLLAWAEDETWVTLNLKYGAETGYTFLDNAETYGGWPDPMPDATFRFANNRAMIYATYTESAGDEPTAKDRRKKLIMQVNQ